MSILDVFRNKIRYDPSQDPSLQERMRIREEREIMKRRFETERNPMTGLTLADMAANRERIERSWHST